MVPAYVCQDGGFSDLVEKSSEWNLAEASEVLACCRDNSVLKLHCSARALRHCSARLLRHCSARLMRHCSARLLRYATALPDCCATALPDCCATALPDCCATALPDCCATALSDCCATALPDCCSNFALLDCSTVINPENAAPLLSQANKSGSFQAFESPWCQGWEPCALFYQTVVVFYNYRIPCEMI
jgi:hypothetical protein